MSTKKLLAVYLETGGDILKLSGFYNLSEVWAKWKAFEVSFF